MSLTKLPQFLLTYPVGDVRPLSYGAEGDGTTDDSAALAAAHATGGPVNYGPHTYGGDESTGYYNLYGATKYKACSTERVQYGQYVAPVNDPEPIKATVKFTNATRDVDPTAWDQVGYYGLVKESGDAYGAALTGYTRARGGSGDQIGIHGRVRLDSTGTSRGYAGWFYAEAYGPGRVSHTLELNTFADTDQGHHATGGRFQAVRICPADNTADANRVSSFLSFGPNNTGGTNNGAWTGLHFEANSILRTAGADDLGEAILVDASTSASGNVGGFTFRANGQPGVFKHALRTKDATFANSNVVYMASGQRLRWSNFTTGPAVSGGSTSVAVENAVLNIASPQGEDAVQVAGTKVLGARQINASLGNTATGTDAALINALRDIIVAHGLGAAA